MRKCLASFIFVAVLLFAAVSEGLAQGTWSVTPGVGAGPIKLGMTISSAEAILTRNSKADHMFIKKRPVWIYYNQGIQINYDLHLKAEQIYVDKPGICTPSGVQVGDPIGKALSAYGPSYISHSLPTAKIMPKQALYVYKYQGIGFQSEGGKVKFIVILNKL